LGSAFTEDEISDAMELMAKFRNQVLKELGREPIPADSERPHRQRVIEVFKKRLGSSK